MTDPKSLVPTDDWRIGLKQIASISLVLSLGVDRWNFYSPRLDYSCYFIVPRGGVGLTIGVDLPVQPSDLSNELASNYLSVEQEDYRILSRFSANDLDGGSFGSFSVGAMGIFAGADGEKWLLKTSAGRGAVRFSGGSVHLGLGVEVNMGTLGTGALYGPFASTRPPRGQ